MELKSQLKAHRAAAGLSQEELAERIYVSRQTISNWETDRTYPDVQSLLLLSDVFGTSIDELVKGDVKAMEETIRKEWKKMQTLCLAAWGLIGAGVACLAAGLAFETGPSSILSGFTEGELLGIVVFFLLWLFGMKLLTTVEKMKKANDLVTYRDIVAFSKGERPVPDKSAFSRRHPLAQALLMFSACAALGGIVAFLMARFLLG